MCIRDSLSPLSTSTQDVTRFLGFASVIAAGNETGLAHHYEGLIPTGQSYEDVEIRVGEPESRRDVYKRQLSPRSPVKLKT